MKSIITKFTLTCLLAFTAFATSAVASGSQEINWIQDYNQAVTTSHQTQKPILLLFTGSGWCSFCNKLEKEVFSSSQFSQLASDKYVFVKLDYAPNGKPKNQSLSQQHQQLSGKYKIEGFPTVLILDQNENLLVRTGYRQGGGEQYATFLESQLGSHTAKK